MQFISLLLLLFLTSEIKTADVSGDTSAVMEIDTDIISSKMIRRGTTIKVFVHTTTGKVYIKNIRNITIKSCYIPPHRTFWNIPRPITWRSDKEIQINTNQGAFCITLQDTGWSNPGEAL